MLSLVGRTVTQYIIRRLLQIIPILFGISVFGFGIIKVAPGDFVTMVTFNPNITDEAREVYRQQLGLDQPLWIQYLRWLTGMTIRAGDVRAQFADVTRTCTYVPYVRHTFCDSGGGIIRLDLGRSLATQEPVWQQMRERMPATFELGVVALFLTFAVGVPLGMLSALLRGSIWDQAIRLLSVAGQAIPSFWLGIICIFVFSVVLGWLPVGGRMTISLTMEFDLMDRLRHILMPAFVLSLGGIAFLTKLVRTQVLEVDGQDYLRTARAKGVPPLVLWTRHILRNALLPLATVLGPTFLGVLGGSLVIETIFAWPGMGRLTWFSALQRDYPMIMGATMFFALLTSLGLLLSDILYGIFDPRIRLQ